MPLTAFQPASDMLFLTNSAHTQWRTLFRREMNRAEIQASLLTATK
jgi:hypothetical protein